MSVEVAVDLLVSMNVNEESYACLEILNKYFLNGAKPEEKYRRIKKTNDVYQVMQTSTVLPLSATTFMFCTMHRMPLILHPE